MSITEKNEFVSVRDWATYRGVDPSYLNRYIISGQLRDAVKQVNGAWKVNILKAEKILKEINPERKLSAEVKALRRSERSTGKKEEPDFFDLEFISKNVADTILEGDEENDDDLEEMFIDNGVESNDIKAYSEAKCQKVLYAARNEKLKYEKNSGLLVEKESVSKAIKKASMIVRNKFLTLPSRVSSEVLGFQTPSEVEIYLMSEVNLLLQELSEYILRVEDEF